MPLKPARVLGPYENGDKFRLVVCEGGGRKSVVVASHVPQFVVGACGRGQRAASLSSGTRRPNLPYNADR